MKSSLWLMVYFLGASRLVGKQYLGAKHSYPKPAPSLAIVLRISLLAFRFMCICRYLVSELLFSIYYCFIYWNCVSSFCFGVNFASSVLLNPTCQSNWRAWLAALRHLGSKLDNKVFAKMTDRGSKGRNEHRKQRTDHRTRAIWSSDTLHLIRRCLF